MPESTTQKGQPSRPDPMAQARLRGLAAARELLAAEGGCVGTDRIVQILGITRQAVAKRRKQGKLIAVRSGREEYAYPLWQFDDKGRTWTGLEAIIAILSEHGHEGMDLLVFFLTRNPLLDGATPLQALRKGQVDSGKMAAQAFDQHGAA